MLIADQNVPIPSYKYLKEKGIDITYISDSGYASIKDEAIIDLSFKDNRIIVTFDSDFGEIIFKSGYKPNCAIFKPARV